MLGDNHLDVMLGVIDTGFAIADTGEVQRTVRITIARNAMTAWRPSLLLMLATHDCMVWGEHS